MLGEAPYYGSLKEGKTFSTGEIREGFAAEVALDAGLEKRRTVAGRDWKGRAVQAEGAA